jgi:hypothetical protein
MRYNKITAAENTTTEETDMTKIDYITYGYNVLKVTVQPAMVSDRQVRVIEMKRPRGRKTVIAVIQETMDGAYCSHSVLA